jgi:hypothetical protein
MANDKIVFGTKKFIDVETGEEIEVQTVYQESADVNFEKIWLTQLMLGIEKLGNKRTAVFSYLLKNRIRSNNMVPKTLMEIVKDTKVSYPTVFTAIKLLEELDLVTRKVGRIYLQPGMIYKGTHDNRMRVMYEFREVKAERNETGQQEAEPKQLQPAPTASKQSKEKQVKKKKEAKK